MYCTTSQEFRVFPPTEGAEHESRDRREHKTSQRSTSRHDGHTGREMLKVGEEGDDVSIFY